MFNLLLSGGLAGIPTMDQAYLATFTFRVSDDAAGTFVVDASDWVEQPDLSQQSFLAASNFGMIAVESTTPAVIAVAAPPGDGAP